MTALGEELIELASEILQRVGDDIADEIEDIELRESTRFWHRGANDYVELMTIEIGDGAHWYVMRMEHAWDLCEVAQKRGGEDIHVHDYVDVVEALHALVVHEIALRISEIL
jgi:hypothetical protein